MNADERSIARRQLDKRTRSWRESGDFARPPRGWIKAIREALGMTTAQLAKRLGVSQSRVVVLEKAEIEGSLTIHSLERAAQALDCQLIYALVPRQSLESTVANRARIVAETRFISVRHTMALEAQTSPDEETQEEAQRFIQRLIDKKGSRLWAEDPYA